MNLHIVSRNIGFMLVLLAVAMGACLGLGYVLPPGAGHSAEKALNGWEISMAITTLSGIILIRAGRCAKEMRILRRDAVGIVGLGWFVCSAFGSLPYLLCEPGLGFAEAYFEAVSGLTTTGASVFSDLASLPETVLMWRSLTQWIGGLGILAMFVLILSGPGVSSRSLFGGESSANLSEFSGVPIRKTARSLWMLYTAFTIVCALGLWALGMTPFQAINHALTTTSTGGFGTEGDSLNGFGNPVRIWVIFFMVICGISFPLYLVMLGGGRDWKTLRSHDETRWFLLLIAAASAFLIIVRWLSGSLTGDPVSDFVETVFNVASISTTTGYAVGDYDTWPVLAKGVILFLMLIGGCAGSTSGGLKVSRMLLWFRMLRIEVRRAFRPNETVPLRLNGRTAPRGTRGQVFLILTSAAAVVAVASFVLAGLEPDLSVDGCASAVLSCACNVGPAFNEFGPAHNFGSLTPPSLVLLSLVMVLGRLEYVAVLALFSRTLWKRF